LRARQFLGQCSPPLQHPTRCPPRRIGGCGQRSRTTNHASGRSLRSARRMAAHESQARCKRIAEPRQKSFSLLRIAPWVRRPALDGRDCAGRLADGELLAGAGHDLEPWRPGGEGVALLLDPPGIGDNPVNFTGERDQPTAGARRDQCRPSVDPRGGAGAGWPANRSPSKWRIASGRPDRGPGWASIQRSRSLMSRGRIRTRIGVAPVRGGAICGTYWRPDAVSDSNINIGPARHATASCAVAPRP
jgi:hypothetical protein